MAIQNIETGEYLKVIGIQLDFQARNFNIVYLIFANAEQRARYDAGLSEYEIYKNGQYNGYGNIDNALLLQASTESVKDNIYSSCYTALKNDMFNNWIDC